MRARPATAAAAPAARRYLGVLLALATLPAAVRPAGAEVFASPFIGYPGINQVVCYLGNTGSAAITVSSPRIINDVQVVQTLSVNSCGGSLAGGRICVWAVDLPANTRFARYICRVDLSSKANARGSIDLRVTPGPTRILGLEMR